MLGLAFPAKTIHTILQSTPLKYQIRTEKCILPFKFVPPLISEIYFKHSCMFKKLRSTVAFSCLLLATSGINAQLNINNATFVIEANAVVTVQGNVQSNVSIGGAGKILLKGNSVQTVNMNGSTIPNLEIDNANNVNLISNITEPGTISLNALLSTTPPAFQELRQANLS